MTETPYVLRADKGGVTTLTPNRPVARNALSLGMLQASLAECAKLMLAIVNLSKPVIAQVHGVATAAGCRLAAMRMLLTGELIDAQTAIGKQAFYRQAELPLADAHRYAAEVMASNLSKRDAQEGIDALIEKRSPVRRAE